MDKNIENLIDKKIDDLALAMHKGFENVAGEISSIKQNLEEVKNDTDKRFEEMETKSQERHNELMNSNDKMIRIFENSQQELASSKFITDKQEERLENHEKRIKFNKKRIKFLELQKAI